MFLRRLLGDLRCLRELCLVWKRGVGRAGPVRRGAWWGLHGLNISEYEILRLITGRSVVPHAFCAIGVENWKRWPTDEESRCWHPAGHQFPRHGQPDSWLEPLWSLQQTIGWVTKKWDRFLVKFSWCQSSESVVCTRDFASCKHAGCIVASGCEDRPQLHYLSLWVEQRLRHYS